MDGHTLLTALAPVAERLLQRHSRRRRSGSRTSSSPGRAGQDFVPGEHWDAGRVELDPAVRSALFVNLLTEDNLPYYTNAITRLFGADSVWGAWLRRWTAEEGRHSIVLRDYLTVTRAIDPIALERARMAQVECGEVPQPDLVHDGIVYVALQELATRIAHLNTGRLCRDAAAYEVMKRIASDENRHYLFYRDLTGAAIELDPSAMVCAIERQVRTFEMPGTGIVDFEQHAASDRTAPASTTSPCTMSRSWCPSCCGTGTSPVSSDSTPKARRRVPRCSTGSSGSARSATASRHVAPKPAYSRDLPDRRAHPSAPRR